MSNLRYIVPGKSRRSIRDWARVVRNGSGFGTSDLVDVIFLLEIVLPQVFPDFVYEVVPDDEMEGIEALTTPDTLVIRISESIYDAANEGAGRPRFTIAHEIGHLILHREISLQLARPKSGQVIKPYEDSEWQANVFAAELLTTPERFAQCSCASEAARRFNITLAAAISQAKGLMRDGLLPKNFPLF